MANTALALSYATLILVDSKLNITEENIDKLVSKAGVKVARGQAATVAKALKGQEVSKWINCGGAAAGGAATTAAPVAVAAKKVEAPKEAPKEEPEEDFDMGGMFD